MEIREMEQALVGIGKVERIRMGGHNTDVIR